jgi:Dolichyl-phosphate-mannose-protein mannosyltransferase
MNEFVKKLPNEKVVLMLAFLVALTIRLLLLNMAFERDEGEYAYAGQALLRGELPYKDFYNMKLPGVYFMYAGFIKLLGSSVTGIRTGLLILNFLTAFFIFRLAQKSIGKRAAFFTCSAFILTSATIHGQGIIANCEHFLLFFASIGLNFLISKKPINLFFAGIFLAISVLMKQHAIFLILFSIYFLIRNSFQHHLKSKEKSRISLLANTAQSLIIFGFGILIPFIGLYFYITKNAITDNFVYFAIKYAQAYAAQSPNVKQIHNFRFLFWDSFAYWLVFFGTCGWMINSAFKSTSINKSVSETNKEKNTWHFDQIDLGVFFLCSFMCVIPGYYFRPHYFLLVLPATSMIIGYGLTYRTEQNLSKIWNNFALLVTFVMPLIISYPFSPYKTANLMYGPSGFPEIREIADSLNKIIKPGEMIGHFGAEPELCFYTNTKMASGYLYAYPLLEKQPYAPDMTHQFIDELKKAKPAYYAFCNVGEGDRERNIWLYQQWDSLTNNLPVLGKIYVASDTVKVSWGDKPPPDKHWETLFVIYKNNRD